MELPISPIITIVLNIISAFLVSKGILDVQTKDTFIMLVKDGISGIMTAFVAFYSIYKIVELHKHQVVSMMNLPLSTITATTDKSVSQPNVSQTTQTVPSSTPPSPAV